MREHAKLLLLTPPLVQTNCPYPATMHLTGYLRGLGFAVEQRDLSIKVALDVLREYGDETTDELLELLQNPAVPPEAKREAGKVIDELAIWIRDNVDDQFGFSRYAERISASAANFGDVERLVRRKGVIDRPLERHLEAAIRETKPTMVGVTCPFPGTLVGAFKIARHLKRKHPGIRTVLGGGFVNTELRDMTDPRPRRYFDEIVFDEGYRPLAGLLAAQNGLNGRDARSPMKGAQCQKVPPFVRPDYDGIDRSEYFDVVETDNPMHRLWSSGRWLRLVMARGCYWHKCAFCDVRLPYIGCFEMPDPKTVVDAMEALGGARTEDAGREAGVGGRKTEKRREPGRKPGFHFVDEAMPPALVRGVSEEIVRRKFRCAWWGNVRFDASFTPELAKLMAKAGCIAVTGGLECADDRLLKLMNKGITLKSAQAAMTAFHDAGIMVHAYLMYGFPTETEREAMGALRFVRDLFRQDLVQSAFWHRFALTVHSPIAAEPEKFGIRVMAGPRGRGPNKRYVFARNEIGYDEPGAPDWERIGRLLNLALYNYLEGRGLGKSIAYWQKAVAARASNPKAQRHKGKVRM